MAKERLNTTYLSNINVTLCHRATMAHSLFPRELDRKRSKHLELRTILLDVKVGL
jgi:hypothetical protein